MKWTLILPLCLVVLGGCATVEVREKIVEKQIEVERVVYNEDGLKREVRVMARPTERTQESDEEADLKGFTDNEFFAVRTQAELEALRKRTGLTELFARQPLDFEKEMVVGAVGARAAQKRNFRIYRVIETPQNLEVQVISFRRGRLEIEATPYVFVRLPACTKPAHFYLNDNLERIEGAEKLATGRNQQVLTRDSLYYVYVPKGLKGPAPLAVLLHGSTTSALNFIDKFESHAEEAGVVLLALTNRNGYFWTEEHDYGAVYDAIAAVCARVEIDRSNMFVIGSSAGGHTSYPFTLRNLRLFKGFCAFCGRLNPAVEDAIVARAKDIPICVIAGENDEMVPLKAIEQGIKRLEGAGAKITFHVIKGAGHNLTREPSTVALAFAWLKEQLAAPSRQAED